MSLNYLKVKHKNYLLELLKKHKNIFHGTLGKYTDSDNTIESKEDVKPYHEKK